VCGDIGKVFSMYGIRMKGMENKCTALQKQFLKNITLFHQEAFMTP
jgi:hypothetical protein